MKAQCGTVYVQQPTTITFTAPEKPGRYFATYKLKANGEELGEKLYLNLHVEAPPVEVEVKGAPQEPRGSSLIDSSFNPPIAEQSPKAKEVQEEKKEEKPLDKASMFVSAIDNGDEDLQNSFEVCSPVDNDKKDDEIIEDMPL